jgi:hypothetical protein
MDSYSWQYNDGSREAAGYRGEAGDCVVRAIAIATGMDYPPTPSTWRKSSVSG